MDAALTWNSLTLEDDEQLTDLYNHLAEVDRTEEFIEIESVREELRTLRLDLARDTVAVRDGDRLIGMGFAFVTDALDREDRARARVAGGVHADFRRQGIGTEILECTEARVDEMLREKHPGADAHVQAGGGLEGDPVRYLLDAHGYRPVRTFVDLTRDLPGEPLTPSKDVEGIHLRTPEDADRESTHAALVEAFRDHWGSAPFPADSWAQFWGSHTSRLEYSTIAVDDEGTVQSYCLTDQWKEGQLYITLVGTRPGARGVGLARAVINRTLRLGIESGMFDRAGIDVDGESLTGANELYAKLGFTLDKAFTSYDKDLGTVPT
jgi:GNAT superfamily N-acetyltransferase